MVSDKSKDDIFAREMPFMVLKCASIVEFMF